MYKNILTTEWVDAVSLQQWLDQNAGTMHTDPKLMHDRDKLGTILLELVFTEIFQLKHIQSDPNPGNFLVTPDCKLALLDFGATRELSQELCRNYYHLCLAALSNNNFEIIKAAKKLGFIHREDLTEAKESFKKIMQLAVEPFLRQEYSWKGCELLKELM